MKNAIKTLKVFYHYETKKKFWFWIFIVSVVITAILSSVSPYFYKLFIDNIEKLDYDFLLKALFLYAGVMFARTITENLSYLFGDIVAFDAGIKARTDVLTKIQDLDFAFHTNKSTGSLISAMKRGDGAFASLHHAIHYNILSVFVSFIVMVFFFRALDPVIAILVLLSFLVSLVIMKFLVGHNISTRKDFNKQEDKITGIIVDNIVNFETVKIFAKERWEQQKLNRSFVPWKKELWRYANSFRYIDLSIGSIINISIFLIILYSLKLSVNFEMSLGEFVLVLGFLGLFFPRLFDLVYGFRNIARHYADIQKYFKILDHEVEIKDPQNPIEIESVDGEINFNKIYFGYKDNKKNAINNMSLKIRQGQSIALVGRSGSGKTTLMKLLMRFYDVDRGSITIDGHNIKDFTKSHLRSLMGVVPQEPIMFNNTIGYNIGYGKADATQKEIEAAAKLANLHKFILTLPKKYKTNVGERGIKLSGGQKQRLAIARMILSDPDIIIFDEATSQLDSENEKMIQDAFWKVSENKTTIVIAHRLSTAARADKIIVMEEGKIVESGSHKALLNKKKSLYRYFWKLQVDVD